MGAAHEARFYADLFAAQDPEQFALLVIDPRCLKNPLLESFISNIRILTDLGLYPTLLVGALDDDRTSVRFQASRLSKELESVSVKTAKFNTATYALTPEIQNTARKGRVPILELTEDAERYGLKKLIGALKPAKVIFLQPSGGITFNGERVPVISVAANLPFDSFDPLSEGQKDFMRKATGLLETVPHKTVYVIASPLNLLRELFTTRGSGTLIRKAAEVKPFGAENLAENWTVLRRSMETAFAKPLKADYSASHISEALIEANYRGGAIVTRLAGLPYLSKFWVSHEARGEGLSRDIWEALCAQVPAFFWRSRLNNPFNSWYMKQCDGMQISGEWRVFWRNLSAPEVPGVIIAAASAPDDFQSQ